MLPQKTALILYHGCFLFIAVRQGFAVLYASLLRPHSAYSLTGVLAPTFRPC